MGWFWGRNQKSEIKSQKSENQKSEARSRKDFQVICKLGRFTDNRTDVRSLIVRCRPLRFYGLPGSCYGLPTWAGISLCLLFLSPVSCLLFPVSCLRLPTFRLLFLTSEFATIGARHGSPDYKSFDHSLPAQSAISYSHHCWFVFFDARSRTADSTSPSKPHTPTWSAITLTSPMSLNFRRRIVCGVGADANDDP